jgi:glycosyltransferase involved in cell wall biosynthesis
LAKSDLREALMRILFLNQYFPPDPAPTGVLLREVADELVAAGHEVDFVAARQSYRGGQQSGGRLRREFVALLRMFFDGVRRSRADVIFSASSPPCLLVVATLLSFWHRAKSVHWAMDLYPEIAVSLGEVREGFFSRMISRIMGWCYRRAAMVVALDSDMAERLAAYGVSAKVVRPWVFQSILDAPMPEIAPCEPWTWLYSGNLGRAHEWETLLLAQAQLEARGVDVRLVLQGGGPLWPHAQKRARELKLAGCEWHDYAPEERLRESLLRAQCCIVTQRPEVCGLLWPSKLGLVLTLPRPILFVGPADGAIARELTAYPHARTFATGRAEEVATWIERLRCESVTVNMAEVFDAREHRAQSLRTWREWLNLLH